MFVQQTFKNGLPTLYLVGTPIGNLADMSYRAVEVLNNVDKILCEDTRTSLTVLNKYAIKKPLLSLHKFNELQRVNQISELLNHGNNLALISDAGVPAISDPGANLLFSLRWIENLSVNFSAINAGPAYIHALILSGFVNPNHYFYGFVKEKSEQAKSNELTQIINQFSNTTLVFYESVHRIIATINALGQLLPSTTKITLNRELTKLNEEIIYGTIDEVNRYVQSSDFVAKGEFVIVIDNQKATVSYTDEELLTMMNEAVDQGLKVKQAAKQVSEKTQVNKNYLYELYVKK